ncbi:MAG TPA: TIM-barrel domain-containing protein, partial [Rhizomicrobium sp.]|nr:TIM-barrel domain-containing protein [Rhizomicrobium sp.]
FEVVDPTARMHGFGSPRAAIEAKPLQTLQMICASRAAQVKHAPDKRPFLVSRSGSAGMQRYVQTWSGDNYTSWETLRFNIRMGLGLALSGISNTGHDVGGFDGPKPDAELFVRWVAFGIFMPRFSIHSWNSDRTANEPWMHPEVTGAVRDLIKLRYRLLPYLYNLTWRYAQTCEPIIRPVFAEFPDDARVAVESDDFMLGASLLAAPVVEPGATTRAVYLPAGADWYDWWTGELLAGGQTITRDAPYDRPPLFARAGSVIALNVADQHFASRSDKRGFAVFPRADGEAFTADVFDDDGVSERWRHGEYALWRVHVEGDDAVMSVMVTEENGATVSGGLDFVLPGGRQYPR